MTAAQKKAIDSMNDEQLRAQVSVLIGSKTENREKLIAYCRHRMRRRDRSDVLVEQTGMSDFGNF